MTQKLTLKNYLKYKKLELTIQWKVFIFLFKKLTHAKLKGQCIQVDKNSNRFKIINSNHLEFSRNDKFHIEKYVKICELLVCHLEFNAFKHCRLDLAY